MTKYDLILFIIYDIVLISIKNLRSLQIKDTFIVTLLIRKKTITNSNKLYRWGEIYVLQCKLMLLQQLKIKLVQVFLAAKGKKIGGGNSTLWGYNIKAFISKVLFIYLFFEGLANVIRILCFLLC